MKTVLLAAALLLLPDAARAQAAGQWQDSRQIWDAACRYCHETTVAPPLLGTRPAADAVRRAVRRGPGGMPSFTPSVIDDAELDRLARWLATAEAPKPGRAAP